MQKTYFMRLCKDCQLLAHLSPADINILYQTEARAAGRALDGELLGSTVLTLRGMCGVSR